MIHVFFFYKVSVVLHIDDRFIGEGPNKEYIDRQ